jgi:hypothetical protein
MCFTERTLIEVVGGYFGLKISKSDISFSFYGLKTPKAFLSRRFYIFSWTCPSAFIPFRDFFES